jgi:hypothetical protein
LSKAREFLDFWIENSVHASEEFRSPGASQHVDELLWRCVGAAEAQGVSKADMEAEVGNLADYIGDKLEAANKTESDRRR